MKLFLLNSIENKESRKIGLTCLGFFYNFLHISKVGQKRKEKRRNSTGPNLAQTAQVHAETRAPAPVLAASQKGPWGFG
jgi:hypothetical protein